SPRPSPIWPARSSPTFRAARASRGGWRSLAMRSRSRLRPRRPTARLSVEPGASPMVTLHFHHYDRSPFSEKVRLAFGLKGLRWHSVIQPRWAPKPDLEPLTGGYRRTPVMQIGADVYCDTRCILAELERRFPEPGLYPDGPAGLGDALESWADRALFADALGFVFGTQGNRFPEALHADRARFTAGRFSGWDPDAMRAQLPTVAVRLRR